MFRDADFFKTRINKLDGAADLGNDIVSIINSKSVAGQGVPPPSSPAVSAPAMTEESALEKVQEGSGA